MVLSFMILWDLPTIRAGVGSLRTSRLANVYTEIAPSFAVFGTLFGKALQAQVLAFEKVQRLGGKMCIDSLLQYSSWPIEIILVLCRLESP